MDPRRIAGRVQAMLLPRQRAMLRDIGREVGAEVVFLKAAWSDAALYGGRGERLGADLDVLVDPPHFIAFAAALEARGYRRYEPPTHRATMEWAAKEWTYAHPGPWMPIDLHRALAEAPWFDLDTPSVLARARDWPTRDETIRSLGVEDQVLYAALHYANHLYGIDLRHADDVVRLLARETPDWDLVFREADRGAMRLVVQLFVEHLRARGVSAPTTPWESDLTMRLRRHAIGHWIDAASLTRRRPVGRRAGTVLEQPVLSDRWSALPRWAARYAAMRVLDRVLA